MVNITSFGHLQGPKMGKFPRFDSNEMIKRKVDPLVSKPCVMDWAAKWARTGLPCGLG